MVVTSSRNSRLGSRGRLFFDETAARPGSLERLRLLTWRRMHELGLKTYQDFAKVSGISEPVIRRVLAPRGKKNVGQELGERWLAALQLGAEDRAEMASWLRGGIAGSQAPLETLDQAEEVLSAAVSKHEAAEFSRDPMTAQRVYYEAAHDFARITATVLDNANHRFQLIKAEALYRLACIDNLRERADRAYWHAGEASSLASNIDGDLCLLAKKQVALACQQLGQSYWREGLRIIKTINRDHRGIVPILGKRFSDQDPGLWARLTYRDAANALLRRRERIEARDALAELRRALRFREEAMDEFLIKVTEARLKIKEGRSTNAIRMLLGLYNVDMPEPGGPRHYQTLISALAEAQVRSGWKDPDGRDFLKEALRWARSSGLSHEENELRLRFREQLAGGKHQ